MLFVCIIILEQRLNNKMTLKQKTLKDVFNFTASNIPLNLKAAQ